MFCGISGCWAEKILHFVLVVLLQHVNDQAVGLIQISPVNQLQFSVIFGLSDFELEEDHSSTFPPPLFLGILQDSK